MRAEPIFERLWSKEDKRGPNECWLWAASGTADGYGRIRSDGHGRMLLAHRVAWESTYGPISADVCVLHKCDTPACVNPSHLFTGTQQNNIQDMNRKGRGKIPYRRGRTVNTATLNECDVRNIRAEFAKGDITQDSLSKFFDVSRAQIGNIVLRKQWAWIV